MFYHRESSHGTKELLNLPILVLKARHLSGSALCLVQHAQYARLLSLHVQEDAL